MREQISAVIISFNEEKNLPRCLKSILWADEILIIDSFSTDNTCAIAREFNARVIQNAFPGYTLQYEFGVGHAKHNWIFIIDADEEVSPELRIEIEQTFADGNVEFQGYDIPRCLNFLGKWIRWGGWYPDYQFRLFNKEFVTVEHQEVHGAFSPKGPIGKLKQDLYHFSYPTIFDYIAKINTYTSLMVAVRLKEGRNRKVRWHNVLLHPLSNFLRMYFTHHGFKDGYQGLILALFTSIDNFIMYVKLWEHQYAKLQRLEPPPITHHDFQKRK